MADFVVPALIDFLVSAAEAAMPTLLVVDGPGHTDDPGDFLLVGVDDPNNAGSAEAAVSDVTWAGLGQRASDEAGLITCAALSRNGDGDQKAARDAAFGTVAALKSLLTKATTDPASVQMSVAGVLHARVGHLRLTQDQDPESGALALVIFDVAFAARI